MGHGQRETCIWCKETLPEGLEPFQIEEVTHYTSTNFSDIGRRSKTHRTGRMIMVVTCPNCQKEVQV